MAARAVTSVHQCDDQSTGAVTSVPQSEDQSTGAVTSVPKAFTRILSSGTLVCLFKVFISQS